jgi:hypothetical protein
MKYSVNKYEITEDKENGRVILELELNPLSKEEDRYAFTTSAAQQFLEEEGYENIAILKGSIAYNWGGYQSAGKWTFKRLNVESAAKAAKPAPKKAAPKKAAPKKVADKADPEKAAAAESLRPAAPKKTKTTASKPAKKKTTQDILAKLKAKGN